MSKYGLVKTITTPSGESIKLTGNALTFILYKSYFGRDLLNDIVSFAGKNANAELVKRFENLNIKSAETIFELDEQQQKEIFSSISEFTFDTEFVLNFIAALMATSRYPDKPDIIDIIMEIPPHWAADREIIGELLEFLTLFITQKKS